MSDIFVADNILQLTSLGTTRAKLYVLGGVVQQTSNACIVDLTPPTFSGIQSATVQSRGQVRAAWLAGTDASLPVRYEVYIKEATSVNLFDSGNLLSLSTNLFFDIFAMPDGTLLKNGVTYYVGVRAIDGVGNRDNNSVAISVISTGVTVAADYYLVDGAFVINSSNQLQGIS